MDYKTAYQLANEFSTAIEPYCTRVEIAGSIRRKISEVKDIEICAIPIFTERPVNDLWGEQTELVPENHLWDHINPVMESLGYRKIKGGDKYRQLEHIETGIALDLFTFPGVRQWGAGFAIRTGPADFIKHIMGISIKNGQHVLNNLLHNHRKIFERNRTTSGGVYKPCEKGDRCRMILETPTENDFFRAVGVPFLNPDQRTLKNLLRSIR